MKFKRLSIHVRYLNWFFFIMRKVILTFASLDKTVGCHHLSYSYRAVFFMWYSLFCCHWQHGCNFKSVRITLLCNHPSESYQAVLSVSCGIVYHVLMRFFFTFIVFDIKNKHWGTYFCDYLTQFRINSAPFLITFRKIRFTPEITALKPDWFLYFLIYECFIVLRAIGVSESPKD